MKANKKEILNIGEDFTYKKGIFNYEKILYSDFKTLENCYNRPSTAKQRVYNYYCDLLKNNTDNFNYLYYGVKSYNSMIITLHAIVEKDGKKYYLYITPSHNYYEYLWEANDGE